MRNPLASLLPAPPPPPPVVLLPGDRFFVRRIELAEDADAAGQVELAIEGLSPFSAAQLYFGHIRSADGRSALVYATYRRRFSTEELEPWGDAACVLPEFIGLCAVRPESDAVVVHQGAARITGLAWRGGEPLPAAVLVREWPEAEQMTFVAELRERAGLPPTVPVQVLQGELTGNVIDGGAVALSAGENEPLALAPEALDQADVREDAFLEARRRDARRDMLLWRALLGAAALLALAAFLDAGAAFFSWQAERREARIEAQTPEVEHLETADSLAHRIAELSDRRLMPFEMLAHINPTRPASVEFQRAVIKDVNKIEIAARTNNAGDVDGYARALRSLPALAAVDTSGVQTRNNVTTFMLALTFRPEQLRAAAMTAQVDEGGAE